ncbi:MAG: hypothetical protein WKF70_03445, partial [Chitinophagaceae bacterium]
HIIQNGTIGMLVQNGNEGVMSAATHRCIADEDLRSSVDAAAQTRIMNFNLEAVYPQRKQLLSSKLYTNNRTEN